MVGVIIVPMRDSLVKYIAFLADTWNSEEFAAAQSSIENAAGICQKRLLLGKCLSLSASVCFLHCE